MNFLKRIAVLFYMLLTMFVGVFLLLFVLKLDVMGVDFSINLRVVYLLFYTIYNDETLRIIFGCSAAGLLLVNYLLFKTLMPANQRSGTIAFDNPSGRVNVSLAALEDLIKRVIHTIPEVREVKSHISASKKGLNIRIKLTLREEGSIPELTSRVQDMVKSRVQEAIGLEEPIDVAIFVGKIIPDPHKPSKPPKKEKEPKETERSVPFHGYRA